MGIVEELQDCARATAYLGDEAVMLRAADLIERLKGYAEHDYICRAPGGPCSCGLAALIKEIGGE